MPTNRITMLRKQNDLNQKELAEKLGVVQTTVSAWETGRNSPDNEMLKKMADLFDVTFEYMAGVKRAKKHPPYNSEEAYQRREERRVEEYLEQMEQYKEEEVERMIEESEKAALMKDFEENGEGMYYGAFLHNRASEFMSSDQRKRALLLLQTAFPKAFMSVYDSD